MTNYSFGAVATLTRNAVATAIPTLAPVNTIVAPDTPAASYAANPAPSDQAPFSPASQPSIIPFASTIESNHSDNHLDSNDLLLAIVLDTDPPVPVPPAPVPPAAASPTINSTTTSSAPVPPSGSNSTAVPPSPSASTSAAPQSGDPEPLASGDLIGTPMCLDAAIEELKSAPITEGAALAADKSVCSNAYRLKKKKILCEFIEAIRSKHPKYSGMLNPHPNKPTDFPPGDVANLFVLLSGSEEKRKKVYVLNEMLID